MMAFGMMSKNNQVNDSKSFILNIMNTFIQMLMISSVKYADSVVNFIKNKFNEYLDNKVNQITAKIIDDTKPNEPQVYNRIYKHDKYSVSLRYSYNKEIVNSIDKKYLDSILYHFTKIYNIPSLQICQNNFIPTLIGRPFEVDDNIYCIIESYNVKSEDNILEKFNLTMYSNIKNSSDIVSYIKKLYDTYEHDKSHELDNNIYIFEVTSRDKIPTLDPRGHPDNSQKENSRNVLHNKIKNATTLVFNKTIFKSNRFPSNVKGASAEKLFKKIDFFANNRAWYAEKGIPYHFTALLSGEPGQGKTSSIKAVANKLKKHVFIINCAKIFTSKQFNNLFYNENIIIYDEESRQETNIKIPIENRIYVLEEIDILGNIVLDREYKELEELIEGQLTLDDFLNTLDGNNESPGRVIIITSNYPERLDRALIRGGRVDIMVKFISPTSEEIVSYIEFFYSEKVDNILSQKIKDTRWVLSYADICQVLFSINLEDDIYSLLLDAQNIKNKNNEECKIRQITYLEQPINEHSNDNTTMSKLKTVDSV